MGSLNRLGGGVLRSAMSAGLVLLGGAVCWGSTGVHPQITF